jgi:pantoate--beta-alanine ligase
MFIFQKINDLQNFLNKEGKKIGFVPTMGALHYGHISLIERAKKENELVVASIFVNPTQFNNPADLLNYPRTPENDLKMLEENGTDVLFIPSIEEMYPSKSLEEIKLNIGRLGEVMEGVFRPGHFNGVVQIVSRLFNIVKPDKAYFGEKDFQQLSVIRFMVKSLMYNVQIVACPTIREKNGLAMSSRNLKLSEEGKQEAEKISRALYFIKDNREKYTPAEIKHKAIEMIESTGRLKTEYIEIADDETLEPISDWNESKNPRSFAAVFCEGIRLIDNMPVY